MQAAAERLAQAACP